MKKNFLVIQPPIAEYFTLLVDDINETETIGRTIDVEKCEYNRGIIERMGIEVDFMIQVQTALSDKGITSVVAHGRYIAIIMASKDETKQEMFFMDIFSNFSSKKQNRESLKGNFSERIVNQFEIIYLDLKSKFTDSDDIVELMLI